MKKSVRTPTVVMAIILSTTLVTSTNANAGWVEEGLKILGTILSGGGKGGGGEQPTCRPAKTSCTCEC